MIGKTNNYVEFEILFFKAINLQDNYRRNMKQKYVIIYFMHEHYDLDLMKTNASQILMTIYYS